MAPGFKTGGKNFTKGKSGNPNGRPKLPEELREIRKLSPSVVKAIISKFASMTRSELNAEMNSPHTPVIELTLGQIYAKAMMEGDYTRLSFLLDRSVGKVKDEIDLKLIPQIIYKTNMTEDGRLFQEVIEGELLDVGKT